MAWRMSSSEQYVTSLLGHARATARRRRRRRRHRGSKRRRFSGTSKRVTRPSH